MNDYGKKRNMDNVLKSAGQIVGAIWQNLKAEATTFGQASCPTFEKSLHVQASCHRRMHMLVRLRVRPLRRVSMCRRAASGEYEEEGPDASQDEGARRLLSLFGVTASALRSIQDRLLPGKQQVCCFADAGAY